MSRWWAVAMLLSGGLFAGGVSSIAWERIPAWRATDLSQFRAGFAHTLRRVDRLQPALLVVCVGSTVGFASSVGGAARALAMLAARGWRLAAGAGRLGGRAGPDPAAPGRVGVGTAGGDPRAAANPVAWRSPCPHRGRAGLLRLRRGRRGPVSTPATPAVPLARTWPAHHPNNQRSPRRSRDRPAPATELRPGRRP